MSNSSNKMSVFQLTILTAVNMMGSGIIHYEYRSVPALYGSYRRHHESSQPLGL